MERREQGRTFEIAALILLVLGVAVRIYLGSSVIREILISLASVAGALLAAVALRYIPWARLVKRPGRFWGVFGYIMLLGLGMLLMLVLPATEKSVAPMIVAVLPLLAQLPLLRYNQGRGTWGVSQAQIPVS